MFRIPPSFNLPVPRPFSNPVPSEPEASTDVDGAPESDQSNTGTATDQLSGAPDCVFHHTAQWLAEPEMLSLIQTNHRHHQLVTQYYQKRLIPNVRDKTELVRLYRDPALRIDRYLCTDRIGRAWLTGMGIYFPLTAKIQSGTINLGQVRELLIRQEDAIEFLCSDSGLGQRQIAVIRNTLFKEHIENDRIDIATARRMSGTGNCLFYSLTLKNLFRSGCLHPADLEKISAPGLQLLHDPLLVGLFQDRLISMQEVLGLTNAQHESILICRRLLMSKQMSMSQVLALTDRQKIGLRKTVGHGLTGAVGIPYELRSMLSKPPSVAMREALLCADQSFEQHLEWIKAFGAIIHHLRPDTIIRYMDTSVQGQRSAFSELDNGLMSMGADQRARAYLQIYIDLVEHISSADYLKVVQPFLSDVFGELVVDAINADLPECLDQCSMIWTLVRTQCAISGASIAPLRALAIPLLINQFRLFEFVNIQILDTGVHRSFGRLLVVMDLLEDEVFFNAWGACLEQRFLSCFVSDKLMRDCYHALFMPFGHFEKGKRILDAIRA